MAWPRGTQQGAVLWWTDPTHEVPKHRPWVVMSRNADADASVLLAGVTTQVENRQRYHRRRPGLGDDGLRPLAANEVQGLPKACVIDACCLDDLLLSELVGPVQPGLPLPPVLLAELLGKAQNSPMLSPAQKARL